MADILSLPVSRVALIKIPRPRQASQTIDAKKASMKDLEMLDLAKKGEVRHRVAKDKNSRLNKITTRCPVSPILKNMSTLYSHPMSAKLIVKVDTKSRPRNHAPLNKEPFS